MINREGLIRKYNPSLEAMDTNSPLTLGNGTLAFTADVTGLQSLYDEYETGMPVLTMTSFGWNSFFEAKGISLSDDEMTSYDFNGRKVTYPVERTEKNKDKYDLLRENPHRFNVARIRLFYDGKKISKNDISNVNQTLDMYTGILTSEFTLHDKTVLVTTVVGNSDTIGVKIDTKLPKDMLSVVIDFPYSSPCITGSDFSNESRHKTTLKNYRAYKTVTRELDDIKYYCLINEAKEVKKTGEHEVTLLMSKKNSGSYSFTVSFSNDKGALGPVSYKDALRESEFRFYSFWNRGAMIDVSASEDKRADELQRRILSSMYLLFVNENSSVPPSETGLSCNSWYGKFHLEMHPIHEAFLPLYGRGDILEASLHYYIDNLDKACRDAKRNKYCGARWPKMTDLGAANSPSSVAPILIWQQPHIIYMINLLYLSRYGEGRVEVPSESEEEFILKYAKVIKETAEFMADFLTYNEKEDCYELLPPLFSVQEKGNPLEIKNPAFELLYFKYGLNTAYDLLRKIDKADEKWLDIAAKIKEVPVYDKKYAAYENCKNTYSELNIDHPSFVFAYGFLPEEGDREILTNSLEEIMTKWDKESLWGWDFAFLSMVLAKAGRMEEAFDVLLMDTAKNTYVKSGNNAQLTRNDLPLYLPGNGSLLLAMSALENCSGWYIQTEGLMKYPY